MESSLTEILLLGQEKTTDFLLHPHGSLCRMGEQNDRLREARRLAGLKDAAAAISKHHWTPSTYRSHENGQTTKIPQNAANKYAKAYNVRLAWLLTGDPPMRPTRDALADLLKKIPPDKHQELLDFARFLGRDK